MILRLLCLVTLELLLPVRGGGEVLATLQEAEYRLAADQNQARFLRLATKRCLFQKCKDRHGKDLLDCLQTHCDHNEPGGMSDREKQANSGRQCDEDKCGDLSGEERISCLMIHCYGLSVDETRAIGRDLWSDEDPDGEAPRPDWLIEGTGQPIIGQDGGEEITCKESCLTWPSEEFHACMRLRCRGEFLSTSDVDEEDGSSDPYTSLPGLLCVAKCRREKGKSSFLQCIQDQCVGSGGVRHVTKRWGTRMCMESKCKHARGKIAYFECGSRNCHGSGR